MLVELKIVDVAYRGSGVARMDDGCVVFVPGALTGETVEARIRKKRKRFADAELVRVITPSPARIDPICPLAAAGTCPGCCYQHVAYEEEVKLKQKQFIDLMSRMGRIDVQPALVPLTASPDPYFYRNKISLHAGRNQERSVLGYIGNDNRSVIDVKHCALAQKPINELLAESRDNTEAIAALAVGAQVTYRCTNADGAIFWVNKDQTDLSRFTEKTPLGEIVVPRRSFYQVNPALANHVTERIGEIIAESSPTFFIDLFCGVGIFAIAALKAGVSEAFGIDSDSRAIRAAKRNATQLANGKFARFEARSALPGLQALPPHVDPSKTMLIVDPPRAGLEPELIEYLASVKPADILYISCAADTLARDAAIFCSSGYTVKSAQIFDMFPRTAYFESLLWLTR